MPSKTMSKTILVLGGSYAGLSVVHYLLRHVLPGLPSPNEHQVVLVSTSGKAMCRPACPRALVSDTFFTQDKLFVEIPKMLAQYSSDRVRFVQGTATQLDHEARKVTLQLAVSDPGTASAETIEYHALVIATGASTKSPLLGFIGDENDLQSSWDAFRKALPTAKHIVIAGGGPAGIETAGELGEYLNGRSSWLSGRRSADTTKVKITVVTAGAEILPQLRPAIAAKAEKFLANVGVSLVKGVRVEKVEPEGAGRREALADSVNVVLSDGASLKADLYIPATGTRPNTDFVPESLLSQDKRVTTNASTLRVEVAGPRVYAIGDASDYARPAVHLILNAVPIMCANIKRDLLLDAGKKESEIAKDRLYEEDKRETQMVPIGTSKGVGAAMGYKLPSWLVWLIKGRDYWLWTTTGLWSGKQWAKES